MRKPPLSTREHALSLIDLEIKRLVQARDILGGKNDIAVHNHNGNPVRRRRSMSAAARRKISIAQTRRWKLLRRKAA